MFNSRSITTLILFCSMSIFGQGNWTHKVRIAGNPLSGREIDSIIKSAVESNVYGIEVDNDITGRYESFLDPSIKLKEIKLVTEAAHRVNNKTFVYIAGLECITADAESKTHTFFKDHPDWVQRDINGKPAIFGGKDAFWIAEGDEDVWISPYAPEWRKLYMQRVKEIAQTGIDGIYVDIPYWMTHFEGWENSWASFDDYTVQAFKTKTGLDAKKDIKPGDYNDPGFIKWINFRMQTLTDFMAEIDQNIKAVNPECKTIAEIYPGISEEAVRVGADVFQMYNVVDVIAHEYSEGEYYASDRAAYDWYNYIIGMHTFRAFAEDKASWMLSYSWEKNEKVDPADAMKNLFASEIFSGTNMWDVKGYIMSSTNNMKIRSQVYKWVAENEDVFYSQRIPVQPVTVYFSDITRNYFSSEFISSYRGFLNLLIHSHIPFQIATSRTLEKLSPEILILPDVRCFTNNETEMIRKLAGKGTHFIITGEFGKFDENRVDRKVSLIQQIFGTDDTAGKSYFYLSECPGKRYTEYLNTHLNDYFLKGTPLNSPEHSEFLSSMKNFTSLKSGISIDAPPEIIVTTSISKDRIFVYLLNINALCAPCTDANKNIKNINITLNPSIQSSNISALPFLENKIKLNSKIKDGSATILVPPVGRGTVIIINRD